VGAVWGSKRWPYFQGADLFCLPTHSENFGIAVLEALHVGTPVLTTNKTPWVDYEGLAGLFISDLEAMGLERTLPIVRARIEGNWSANDRDSLARWAEATFAWERLAPDYAEAYQRCLQREWPHQLHHRSAPLRAPENSGCSAV
jgi:glycosyltransferase involved in cell wall biosynthesis